MMEFAESLKMMEEQRKYILGKIHIFYGESR